MGRVIISMANLMLAIIYMYYGRLILDLLKKYFKDFYGENKRKLVFASVFLSVPLLIRTVWDALLYFPSEVKDWIESHLFFLNLL